MTKPQNSEKQERSPQDKDRATRRGGAAGRRLKSHINWKDCGMLLMVSPTVCGICALHVSGSSAAHRAGFARPGSKKGHSQSQGIRLVLRRAPSLGDTYRSWQSTWLERRQRDGGSGQEHSRLWGIYHQCPLLCLTTGADYPVWGMA
jgi:hypothetical protein